MTFELNHNTCNFPITDYIPDYILLNSVTKPSPSQQSGVLWDAWECTCIMGVHLVARECTVVMRSWECTLISGVHWDAWEWNYPVGFVPSVKLWFAIEQGWRGWTTLNSWNYPVGLGARSNLLRVMQTVILALWVQFIPI